jgi:hypothetical protein
LPPRAVVHAVVQSLRSNAHPASGIATVTQYRACCTRGGGVLVCLIKYSKLGQAKRVSTILQARGEAVECFGIGLPIVHGRQAVDNKTINGRARETQHTGNMEGGGAAPLFVGRKPDSLTISPNQKKSDTSRRSW